MQYSRAARVHTVFHREMARVVNGGLSDGAARAEQLIVGSGRYAMASAVLERAFTAWQMNEKGYRMLA
ncbi:MAG TPA: hypothetical protein VMA36_15980 [Candidatus Limnocylindria bacterium]|nr:hypothetical protein [Candidatus Limnocylindria bacterium]